VFAYAGGVIRIRSVPITDDEARELADLLVGDEAAEELVGRIERALVNGMGLLGTNRLEARATLFAVQKMLAVREHSPRLLELRTSLTQMLES
jgi:hypothetical protein